MSSASKLTATTRSIDDLYQLHREGRLDLHPDYQRNSVWPPRAKAYLVDTVLVNKPIPMLFLFKYHDANTNRMHYRVIDGQQRLRAVFAFVENRFGANESSDTAIARKKFKALDPTMQADFMSYSFVVMEMSGYSEEELRDVFARINKYVVSLNAQELRDAQKPGPFKEYVDDVVTDSAWGDLKLFTKAHESRKRDKEFVAELTVLMLEGPQDKKGSLDLYYVAEPGQFDEARAIKSRLLRNVRTATTLLGDKTPSLRKLPAFYGLMGALFNMLDEGDGEERRTLEGSSRAHAALESLEASLTLLPNDPAEAALAAAEKPEFAVALRFRQATSRQTDNIRPRTECIQVFEGILREAMKPESTVA